MTYGSPVRTLSARFPFRRLVAAFVCILSSALAQSPATRTFDLPADSAAKALRLFSDQAGVQVMYPSDVVEGVKTHAVKGEMTPHQALNQMLAGTVLVGVPDEATGSLTIVREDTAEKAAKNVNRALAQDSGRPEKNEKSEGSQMEGGVVKMPDYMVTGSKTLDADIRRTKDDPMPYTVFSHEDIEKSNASSLDEFFRTRLPMNSGLGPNGSPLPPIQNVDLALGQVAASNFSSINLRGLGANQTLILIDGRRAPRPFDGTDFAQADVNAIPMAMVDRIEVLSSSAGGIYGGGATGGVINIIRKRNYSGLDVQFSYGGTFEGGGEEYRADISGGLSVNGGRTRLTFSASRADSELLLASDRLEVLQHARELYATKSTGTSPARAYTTNIRSASPLVLDNGTPLNSNRTYIPVGYAGVTSDNGAALVANAGQQNTDLSNDVVGASAPLRNNPRVQSADISFSHEFTSRLEVFGSIALSDNLGRTRLPSLPTIVSLPALAAGNPFGQAITVAIPVNGVPTEDIVQRGKTQNATAGITAKVGHDWSATVEYDRNDAQTTRRVFSTPLNIVAFNAAVTSGAVNVFRDLNINPIDFTPFLNTSVIPTDTSFQTRSETETARASGPLFSINGGPSVFTIVLEHRKDSLGQSQLGTPTSITLFPENSQSVTSGYLELAVPLVTANNSKPFAQAMDLQLSLRHDRYHTLSGLSVSGLTPSSPPPTFTYSPNDLQSTNATFGVRWSPLKDFSWRASYATGFLPPSISQIAPQPLPNQTSLAGIADPLRGGEQVGAAAPYTLIFGGSPSVRPEKSDSLSAGMIFTPHVFSGLRFSVDYAKIRKQDEILGSPPTNEFFVINEATYPGRIVRGTKLSADPAGFAGPVIQIDDSAFNVAQSWVQAWDFSIDYDQKTSNHGAFHYYAIATYQSELRRQFIPGATPVEMAGAFDGPLKFRGNAGLDWIVGRWSFSWNVQYYDSYSLISFDPNNAAASATRIVNNGGALRVPSQAYHDLGARYRFSSGGSRLLAGIELSAGIQNILNKIPPSVVQSVSSTPSATYSGYGDPRLRRFTFSLKKHF